MRNMLLIAAAACLFSGVAMADEAHPDQPNNEVVRPNVFNGREEGAHYIVRVEDRDVDATTQPIAVHTRAAGPEKGAYLGVSVSPPPPVLQKQLSLQPGMSLVIDYVVGDSPAAKAGVEQFDVLVKLDDQLIISPGQLSVLVRSHKPGDEVKLSIIHQGKPATVGVKLIEHEVEPLATDDQKPEAMVEARLDAVPGAALRWQPTAPAATEGDKTEPKRVVATASATWVEPGRFYTLSISPDGKRSFLVKDASDSVIFQGPVDNAEQRTKLTSDQLAKLRRMEDHLNGQAPGAPATQPGGGSGVPSSK